MISKPILIGVAVLGLSALGITAIHAHGVNQGRLEALKRVEEDLRWSQQFCHLMSAEPDDEDAYCSGRKDAFEVVAKDRRMYQRFGNHAW